MAQLHIGEGSGTAVPKATGTWPGGFQNVGILFLGLHTGFSSLGSERLTRLSHSFIRGAKMQLLESEAKALDRLDPQLPKFEDSFSSAL